MILLTILVNTPCHVIPYKIGLTDRILVQVATMTTVAQSSFASNIGIEDAMEMSNDSAWRAHESDEIEIDSDFGEPQDNVADEEMSPVYDQDNSLIPLDAVYDIRHEHEASDAPMHDRGSETNHNTAELEGNKDVELGEASDDRYTGKNSIEEDLLDETDEALSDSEQPKLMNGGNVDHQADRSLSHASNEPPTNSDPAFSTDRQVSKVKEASGPSSNTNEQRDSTFSHEEAVRLDEVEESQALNGILAPVHPTPEQATSRGSSPSPTVAIEASVTADPILEVSGQVKPPQPRHATPKDIEIEISHQNDLKWSVLHPVFVIYQDQETPLFQNSEGSEPYLLEDQSLARGGMLNLLSACREVIQHDMDENEELEIAIEDLDLKVREVSPLSYILPLNTDLCDQSSLDFPNISFARIVELFVKLHRNDGALNAPPLYVYLYTVTNHPRWWTHLVTLEAKGAGISAIMSNEDAKEVTGPEGFDANSTAVASNTRQGEAPSNPEMEDGQTGHFNNQQDIISPSAPGDLDYEREFDHVTHGLISSASGNDIESKGVSGATNNFDNQGLNPGTNDVLVSSSKATKEANDDTQLRESSILADDSSRMMNTNPILEGDQQHFAKDLVEAQPDRGYQEENTDQDLGIELATEDYVTLDAIDQADADDPVRSDRLARNTDNATAYEEHGDSLVLQQQASQADLDDDIHFEGEDDEDLQENLEHVEDEGQPHSDSVGSGRELEQAQGGEDKDYFNTTNDADIGHAHGTESDGHENEDILTDEEIDELNNVGQDTGEIVSNQLESRPAPEGNDSILDEEDWDVGNDIEPPPDLLPSPGSLKRSRSWTDGQDIDGEREENVKRSRAS